MYKIRRRELMRPQPREMIEISAQGVGIPLQHNWPNQWHTLPPDFKLKFDKIYNFEVYDDDVFIVTFPKCGTTWMQETAWLLLNDLDYLKAKELDLFYRSVFLDYSALYKDQTINSIEMAAKLPRPRFIKTHLPAHLMPQQIWQKKTKIIYCARNPKDVVVSFYHFHKGLGTWQGSVNEFVDDFKNSDIMYTPYWPHILNFWHMCNTSKIFFTTFEKMKQNLKAVVIDLNRFLEKPPLSNENLLKLIQHLDFDSMKANIKTNPTEIIIKSDERVSKDFQFMRRGITGAYRDELSIENQQKLNEWSKKCLEGQGVTEQDIFGCIKATGERM